MTFEPLTGLSNMSLKPRGLPLQRHTVRVLVTSLVCPALQTARSDVYRSSGRVQTRASRHEKSRNNSILHISTGAVTEGRLDEGERSSCDGPSRRPASLTVSHGHQHGFYRVSRLGMERPASEKHTMARTRRPSGDKRGTEPAQPVPCSRR